MTQSRLQQRLFRLPSSNVKFFISTLVVAVSMLASVPSALAQQPAPARATSTSGWSWSGHVDHVNFDKEVAWEQGIDDSGTAIGFAAERYTNTSEMTLSLGLNILLYNDNDEFAQYVEDYWGDVDYEESDASAGMVFIEYGPKYRFGQDNLSFFILRGGFSAIFASERSIGDCRNCYSEDIDVDGGAYGVLGIGQTFGNFDIGLQFQQYFSGDIDNSLRLKISGAF